MRISSLSTRVPLRIALVTSVLLLTACASDGSSDADPGTVAATSTVVGSTVAISSTAPTTAPTGATVGVNSASLEELTAAFEAAGVPNAANWAAEVVEYRPYEPSDVQFAKLRTELDKYGVSEETFALIVSVLNPS